MIGESASSPARNRAREDAGKSEYSWRKHEILKQVATAQAHAFRYGIKRGRGIIIDMHAGDGKGVEQPQGYLFGANPSLCTPELSIKIAHGNDVVLCEKNKDRRIALQSRWAGVPVLKNHRLAVETITPEHSWAIVLNDPCGPRDQGVEHMEAISSKLKLSDFIIAINHSGLARTRGNRKNGMRQYDWMVDLIEWRVRLNKKIIAVSHMIHQSSGFRYQVLVVTNFLSDGVRRNPLFEVL
jgi:hypothetical protein